MDAHRAVDSLLGHLTNALVNEAQLLGGVRSDVEFIKDEMESMNALLRHLTEAQHRDHQVWAWMKQVVGLTRDCEGNVELYIHYVDGGPSGGGVLGYLRRVRRFLRTVPVRHRIATRIRELKVRARDVGDRRQRYGVIVPPEVTNDGGVEAAGDEKHRLWRRAVLFEYAEIPADKKEVVTKGMDTVIDLLQREQGRTLGSDATHKQVHMCWCPSKSAASLFCRRLKRAALPLTGLRSLARSTTEREPAPATAAARYDGEQQLRVFCIMGRRLAHVVAEGVYQHPAVATSFGCKVVVHLFRGEDDARTTLAKILEAITGVQPGQHYFRGENDARITLAKLLTKQGQHSTEKPSVDEDVDRLARELQEHLKGKRFLITVYYADNLDTHGWKLVLDALLHAADGCHPASAIIMIRNLLEVGLSSSYKIINARKPPDAQLLYTYQARKMGTKYYDSDGNQSDVSEEYMPKPNIYDRDEIFWRENSIDYNICDFFEECLDNVFAKKMFLHLLYVNPERTEDDLQRYKDAISECRSNKSSTSKEVLMWCYNELPSKYRSCLLYLTIFPKGHVIKTTSLHRRWVADGLITTTASDEKQSATDEAEHHLDVLFTRGFASPVEISPGGDIKSFTLHHEVRQFITNIARDLNFVETNQPTELAHHFSIHNRIGLRNSHSECHSKDIVAYLPSLAASHEWQLLKVLDLEACKGLKKKHLKSICKILLLKYLSLRNTDVEELPKQIKDLQCLETLDIRETKVRMLAKKAIVLPLLKNFLGGHKISTRIGNRTSAELIATVSMPLIIQRMKNMEILSHVQVTDSDRELAGIAHLLKLRKLGVGLHGKNAKLNDLFRHIEKLGTCLCSLSIRIGQTADSDDAAGVEDALTPPQFIRSLKISGLTNGLPHLIEDLHKLVKLTLSETYLKEEDLCILGKLGALRYLRLRHKSYMESELAFKEDAFQCVNYLLVEGNDITKISFVSGAACNLERIVWYFDRMESLSGLEHLDALKKLELNGESFIKYRDEML